MKLSRKTKTWLKIQEEIYQDRMHKLTRPYIDRELVTKRIKELLDETRSRLQKEGVPHEEVEQTILSWTDNILGLKPCNK